MKYKIEFKKIHIHDSYGEVSNNVYLIFENNRCKLKEELQSLQQSDRDDIIDLVSKMATIKNFRSPKLKRSLKGYSYGEIKPHGHRVFFFRKCGNNYILFGYKKKKDVTSETYKRMEKRKEYYEKEFKKYR